MKKIVTIGGGTGTFVVLSALKQIPGVSLSAIVTTADDGGSTGHLRDAYGILPVGDARQALVALSEDETTLRKLFAYRFQKGNVAGHNLGNLFLTALSDLLGSEAKAIKEASDILRVRGTVIPASEQPSVLVAHLTDDSVIRGEHAIDRRDEKRLPIKEVSLETPVQLSEEARTAIAEADFIVLGPGDLYTSTAAALLVSGMKEALAASRAKFVYIANLFTKAGQTGNLAATEHASEITRYAGRTPDVILMHEGAFAPEVLAAYAKEGEQPVVDDFKDDGRVRRLPLASVYITPALPEDPVPRSLIRHDSGKLREAFKPLLA